MVGLFHIKTSIFKLLNKTGIDNKMKNSKLVFRLYKQTGLLFSNDFCFHLALEKLGMSSVLDPLKNMLDEFTGFIPNIIGAGLVCYIGYMLATIVSELVELSGDSIQKLHLN